MNPVSMALPKASDIRALAEACDSKALGRLAEIAQRNEQAVSSLRAAQRELAKEREEHDKTIARERKDHDAALAAERIALDAEISRCRAQIEADERQAKAALEKAEKDGKSAAAMRKDLQDRLSRLHELAA
jgi:hypothetical protein